MGRVDEPVPGYPKRPVPLDEDATKALKKRTLTNRYNARPQGGLVDAHEALGAVVAAAYGWSVDLSDDDVLRALLALNDSGSRASLRQRRVPAVTRGPRRTEPGEAPD